MKCLPNLLILGEANWPRARGPLAGARGRVDSPAAAPVGPARGGAGIRGWRRAPTARGMAARRRGDHQRVGRHRPPAGESQVRARGARRRRAPPPAPPPPPPAPGAAAAPRCHWCQAVTLASGPDGGALGAGAGSGARLMKPAPDLSRPQRSIHSAPAGVSGRSAAGGARGHPASVTRVSRSGSPRAAPPPERPSVPASLGRSSVSPAAVLLASRHPPAR